MSEKLKPCPFCGGNNIGIGSDVIVCDCGCHMYGAFETEEEAIQIWNKRVSSSNHNRLLKTSHVAQMTGLTPTKIQHLLIAKKFPEPVEITRGERRTIYYWDKNDIEQWLDKETQS